MFGRPKRFYSFDKNTNFKTISTSMTFFFLTTDDGDDDGMGMGVHRHPHFVSSRRWTLFHTTSTTKCAVSLR
jgi:hypothetical protein